MAFGQCFVPPLTPTHKESSFDKKGLRVREKKFSRFLRGIIRSPTLASHPAVLEFLNTDHYAKDKINGLKEFTKTLGQIESGLKTEKIYKNNNNYRISTFLNSI